MFERYTEKARRVIFFARYEASQFGSPYIETEHLLLGLLRETKALATRFLRSLAAGRFQPRSGGGRYLRFARSAHRPRLRARARGPDPLPPDKEQPGADRRAWCR